MSPGERTVRIVHVYPTILGLYGDRGNALVLAHRARRRGFSTEVLEVAHGQAIPVDGDVYVLGGGEDVAQIAATDGLRSDGGLARALDDGAALLAVCAGLQVLGETFTASGSQIEGLGLLDVTTGRREVRAVGELVADPVGLPGLAILTGFENHGGATTLGPRAVPLARVVSGVGNGDGSGTEGAVQGRVVATYLHGPVLARNPALADHLLAMRLGPLEPLSDPTVDRLRAERLASAER
jgi:CobQ-like glutamine amidotransferase family enzyme